MEGLSAYLINEINQTEEDGRKAAEGVIKSGVTYSILDRALFFFYEINSSYDEVRI